MSKIAASNALAYHLAVEAVEARAGWTPMSRFASAIMRAINGHFPYERYHAAGMARRRDGVGEASLEVMVKDFLATDLTAAVMFFKDLSCVDIVMQGYNAYNASANLGVRTTVAIAAPSGDGRPTIVARRDAATGAEDPQLCKCGNLVILDVVLGEVQRNSGNPAARGRSSVSGVARLLGVGGSAAAEVALVFESEGSIPIGEVAARLGCHQRTLERRLRESGLTPEMVRQATRLVRSTNRIWSSDSLTTIAVEEGFSDLAHMTRSFQTAAGLPPGALRKFALAEAAGAVAAAAA